MLKIT